jgi:hypothetical protein
MTTRTEPAYTPTAPCNCGSCNPGDLPVNPFLALRVAYGMLLGEDDFRTLMGNPRGKHQLHQAWQHGRGVVWGYRVDVDGVWTLKVSPGLAVDGVGRELITDVTEALDVREWLKHQDMGNDELCRSQTLKACLVVRFDCCPSDPVPTLSDPCDITRKHDDYSRVVERGRLELLPGTCRHERRPYHRVRVLLGLDPVGDNDKPGQQAMAALDRVQACAVERRAREMLDQFRQMAAYDVADLEPATEKGETSPTLFPVLDTDSAVVLADVDIDVRERDGHIEIEEVRPDCTCRTALLPTATIQELACGLAPATAGDLAERHDRDAGGPRVIPDSLEWRDGGRLLAFTVTAPLAPGSLTRRSVRITSLGHRGWVDEDIYTPRYDPENLRVEIPLAQHPVNDLVRIIVRGTGSMPVFGTDPPVPLAGLYGGPPATVHDGHDAVLMFSLTSGAQS